MLTITKLLPHGHGLSAVLLKRAPQVERAWAARAAGRFEATDSSGRRLQAQLPDGTTARDGDVLVAADGSLVRVVAAAEPVLLARPCAGHGSPFDLLRAAYHLGQRHVPMELQAHQLKLLPGAVPAEVLDRLHLETTPAHEPFQPEAALPAPAPHVHGPGCGHDHGDDHGHGHHHHGDGHSH